MNQQISKYMTGEFLFHGSVRASMECLVPNKPRDAGYDHRDKEVAVYATEDVSGAIIFALIAGFVGTFTVTRNSGVTTSSFPECFSQRLSSNTGSLYVMRKSDFTAQDPWQHKSYIPVTPIAEITVSLSDYRDFGGRLAFTDYMPVVAPPADLVEHIV